MESLIYMEKDLMQALHLQRIILESNCKTFFKLMNAGIMLILQMLFRMELILSQKIHLLTWTSIHSNGDRSIGILGSSDH